MPTRWRWIWRMGLRRGLTSFEEFDPCQENSDWFYNAERTHTQTVCDAVPEPEMLKLILACGSSCSGCSSLPSGTLATESRR
jgi:hypothetical protein